LPRIPLGTMTMNRDGARGQHWRRAGACGSIRRSVAALGRFREGPWLNSPRTGHGRRFARALIALAAVFAFEAHPETSGTFMVGACKLDTIGPGVVTGIVDARTVLLDGGREARLAGIEVPAAGPTAGGGDVLPSLVGRDAILRRIGAEQDRYGRLLVHLFVSEHGSERWIQADLIERGQARVASRVGDRACARELLARESKAREAKLGVWAEPVYGIMQAEEPAAVAAERGRFAIVEGKVLSVRESGNTIFVNFGRRWTEDFVVTIAKRNERGFAAAGLQPARLQGRRVRVRGIVEQRGGPWIEATHPEQIEVLEHN
jgi:endonuclease YncB( thermonuclease family)